MEEKIRTLEYDKKRMKDKVNELTVQCENSERMRFEMLEEYEEMKKEVMGFRSSMQNDKETTHELREVYIYIYIYI